MDVQHPTKSATETEETWKENLRMQYNVAYGVFNRH